MNALLAILEHHLRTPAAPPLVVQPDGPVPNTLVPDPNYMAAEVSPGSAASTPDRIVVYLAFPKNNWVIHKVRADNASLLTRR